MNPEEQQNPFNSAPPDAPLAAPDPNLAAPNPVPTVAPVEQSATFPSAPTPVPSMVPPKKSKKGLIIGLSVGGAVLLIGIVTLVLVLLLGGISRQDYNDAQAKAKDAVSSYNEISGVYISQYDTSSAATNKLDTLKTNQTALDKDLADLGDMKAVKNDNKAADYYAKVVEQKKNLDAYIDVQVEYLEVIYPVVKDLGDVSYTDFDSSISALKGYQAKLEALDLKQKVNKDYIDEINSIMPDFISAIQAYADAYNSGDYASADYSKISDLSTKLTDADSTWKSNFDKLYDNVDFSGTINDLGYYLTDKANGK